VPHPEIPDDAETEPRDVARADDLTEQSQQRADAVRRAVKQYLATTAV